jgi:DNA-binding Xre family transcriptional regulator
MALKNLVKELLTEKGITAYQFIKDTGISGTTGYELARNPWHIPSARSIAKICDTYEIQPSKIIAWVKESNK